MKMLAGLRLLNVFVTMLVLALLAAALLTNMTKPLYSQSAAPSAPTNVTITQKSVGERTVTVSWDSVQSVGYYLVRWRAVGTPTLNQGIPLPWHQNPADLDVSEFGDWVFRLDACAGTYGEWHTHDHAEVCNGVSKQVSVRKAVQTATPTPAPTPLPKPTGLTLTQSENSANIVAEWGEVENATRYKVRWRDSGSRLGDPVYVTDTEYTVPLTEYGSWTIRVEACDADICGEPNSKAITTQHPWTPSLSYLRQQLPGKRIVEWQINRVQGPSFWYNKWRKVGEDVSEYRKPYFVLGPSLPTLYYKTVLPESGEWILRIEACEAVPNAAPFCVHNEFTIDVPPQFDPSVTGLTLSSEPGTKTIRASWDSVHESVSRYKILYRASDEQSGSIKVDATEANIPVPSYGSWEVQVAPCAEYCSPFTDVETVNVRRTPPDEPTGIKLSQDPAGSLRLIVRGNTAARADNYKIRWREAGPGNNLNAGITVPNLGTDQSGNPITAFTHPITVSGYGTWVVRVDACNEEGCTGASKTVKVEPLAPPLTIAVFTTVNSPEVTVSWSAVSGADEYVVKWRQAERGGFATTNSVTVSSPETSATFNVSEYTEWVVRVQACNSASCSGPATHRVKVRHEVLNPLRPDTPSNLAVSAPLNSTEVTASWDAVDNADEYVVKWRRSGSEGFDPENSVIVPSSQTSVTFDANSYDEWTIRLEACNFAGCGRGVAETISLVKVELINLNPTNIAPVENFQVSLPDSYTRSWVWMYFDRHPIVDEPTGYFKLWRGVSSTGPYSFIRLGDGGGGTKFGLILADYGTWDIMVQACNFSGCGPMSVETITVPPPDDTQ